MKNYNKGNLVIHKKNMYCEVIEVKSDGTLIITPVPDKSIEIVNVDPEALDGVIITPDFLREQGYEPRTILSDSEGHKTDWTTLIPGKSDTEFWTVELTETTKPGVWNVTVKDSNFQVVGTLMNVYFWHNIQNLITIITNV
jgi:hypothetical protein